MPYMTYNKLIGTLFRTGARRATKFITPTFVIKATRIGKIDERRATKGIRLTVGAPNFAERARIKEALRAGEPFPIRKIQLKHPIKRT